MMTSIFRSLQLVAACGIVLSGCAGLGGSVNPQQSAGHPAMVNGDPDLVSTSYWAADSLIENAKPVVMSTGSVLVASLVDIDDLDQSSTLGRLVAEQIGSRLGQLGYTVKELKLRSRVLVRQGDGQFVLSRNVRDISAKADAQLVVAGTYAIGKDTIYLNLRLIRADDGLIMSSFDYRLGLGPNMASLVRGNGRQGERVQIIETHIMR